MSRREGKQPMVDPPRKKKRKGVEYVQPRNPNAGIRIGSPRGGTDEPMPFAQRFISPKAMKLFTREYVSRKMLVERPLVEAKVDPAFLQMLRDRGWEVLMVVPKALVNDTMVREFYANLDNANLEDGYVVVRKVKVPFSPKDINATYRFEVDEDVDHRVAIAELVDDGSDPLEDLRLLVDKDTPWTYKPGKKDVRKELITTNWSEDWRVKCKFIQNRVRPTDNITHFGLDDLSILYAMEWEMDINVGQIIYAEVIKHLTKTNRCIICPHLIYRMCLQAGVPEYKADHKPKNPRGIQREIKRVSKQAPTTSSTNPPTGSAPIFPPLSTLSPSDRLQLSIAHSIRKWLTMLCGAQNDILANQSELNKGNKISDESRLAPTSVKFTFEADIEKAIASVVPGSSEDDEESDAESTDGEASDVP